MMTKFLKNIISSSLSSVASNYLVYVSIAGAVAVSIYIFSLKQDIASLKKEINRLSAETIISSQNLELCHNQIEKQNRLIEMQEKDYSIRLEEYKKKLKQKKKVRYKVIYQTIGEKKSDDCEDIKTMLDGIRTIDINSLR